MSRLDRPDPLPDVRRIGLVLCSPAARPIPSTRIAVLSMLPYLEAAGLETRVIYEPPQPTETPDLSGVAERAIEMGCDVVILQKVRGAGAVALAKRLAIAGIRTVYAVCDLVEPEMVEATTVTVAVTEYLRSLHPPALQPRMHVVHDGIEHPERFKATASARRGSRGRPLRAVLVTSAAMSQLPSPCHVPPWLELHVVGRYPARRAWLERLRLGRRLWAEQSTAADRRAFARFAMNPRIHCEPWHPAGVYDELLAADIGIIPIDTEGALPSAGPPPSWAVKSENRLTLMMAAGLPVVVTPIPSYLAVVRQGQNAFLARTPREWVEAFDALRDPALRQRVGTCARNSVIKDYSQERQAQRFIDVLLSLSPRDAQV